MSCAVIVCSNYNLPTAGAVIGYTFQSSLVSMESQTARCASNFHHSKKKSRLQALYPPDSFMGRIATDDVSAPDVLFWLTMIPLIIFKMCSIWNVSKMKMA